jgi:hypothetical protein
MFKSRFATSLAITCLILVVSALFSISLVNAATNTLSGAWTLTDPTGAQPWPDCSSSDPSAYHYDVYPVYVTEPGLYSFTITVTTPNVEAWLGIYTSYNPLNASEGCLAVPLNPNIANPIQTAFANLEIDKQYYILAIPWDAGDTGAYTLEATGPGEAAFSLLPTNVFGDSRINGADIHATAIVYCVNGNYDIYGLDEDGLFSLAIRVTPDMIAAVPTNPETNALIGSGMGINFYRLTSGEFQVVGPTVNGKAYNLILTSCSIRGLVRSFMTP